MRLLLVTSTTGYQARAVLDAAARLGVQVVIASDRCRHLDDPWRDAAVAVRFHAPAPAIAALRAGDPFDGIVALGDRPAVLAAHLAAALNLPFHSVAAATLAHDKFAFKLALERAGLPVPRFDSFALEADPAPIAAEAEYPCVLKPLGLSASRGVIRADSPAAFLAAFARIRRLLESPEIRQHRESQDAFIQVEQFLPGPEFALEAWVAGGRLQPLALFDKPDPLEGPFFEESLYLTPSRQPRETRLRLQQAVAEAAHAAGLGPGPVHAEIRLSGGVAYVLEIAARPIGGLCSRALRFLNGAPLEEFLVRAALGESLTQWRREAQASGVLMIPIPRSGIFDGIDHLDAARALPHVEAIEITARPGEALYALPEGATYLGFAFARAPTPEQVEDALRRVRQTLAVRLRPALPVA